ncbi:cupin domain-containing protein [Elioraea rosea]|uniref:cupin domain-containing protein n=1 Tax=Elioraea rosea TaxID=2492390 RepID=UPI001182FD95|nr:cupin domain-containing protein [Elioraea rosea]
MARAVDTHEIEERGGTSYPAPFHAAVAGRFSRRLGDAFSLTQFGVNLVRLAPGAASSLRHAHSAEDEFVMVLEGTPTLITNDGEQPMTPGMVVGFPCDTGDAHCLVNRTEVDAVFLVVGTKARDSDVCAYPDVDLHLAPGRDGRRRFLRKDGTAW